MLDFDSASVSAAKYWLLKVFLRVWQNATQSSLLIIVLERGTPTVAIRRSNRNQGRMKMLVLSRKVGDKLVIDGSITVEVVRIHGNRITLGVVAPSDVKILRGELAQKQTQTVGLVVEDGLLVAC